MISIFDKIIAPINSRLKSEAKQLENDSYKYRLSFYFFTLNLLYGLIKGVKSVSLLITDIKTSPEAQKFGLIKASKSMYSEAFIRYDPVIYRRIFFNLIEHIF